MDRPDWLEEGATIQYLAGHTNFGPRWKIAVVKKISQDDDTCLIQLVNFDAYNVKQPEMMWVDWDQVSELTSNTYWR